MGTLEEFILSSAISNPPFSFSCFLSFCLASWLLWGEQPLSHTLLLPWGFYLPIDIKVMMLSSRGLSALKPWAKRVFPSSVFLHSSDKVMGSWLSHILLSSPWGLAEGREHSRPVFTVYLERELNVEVWHLSCPGFHQKHNECWVIFHHL